MLTAIAVSGALGMLLFLAWELLSWQGKSGAASLVMLLIPVFTVPPHILVLFGPRTPQSAFQIVLGSFLLLVSGYLLYRSLWAELPKQTYSGDSGGEVCKRGTYALTRHPGLWWYGLFLVGLNLVSGAVWLRWAGPVWWAADLFIVTVEDFYLYPKMFRDYGAYKKEVPFLIPGSSGVKNCISTWRITNYQDNNR